MRLRHRIEALVAATTLVCSPAWAITLGASDTFSAGNGGWVAGTVSPAPPTVQGGGPGGAADNYLQITSTGIQGPGGRLTAFNELQWTGDYLGAAVTSIEMDVNNLGDTALSLRLLILGTPPDGVVSNAPVLLPANSGWTHVSFSLASQALAGPALAVLSGVTHLRLYHGTTLGFPGENIAAVLGVDNITAVPEPAPALMLALGLAALGVGKLRRGKAQQTAGAA